MASRDTVTSFLNGYLRIAEIKDSSLNGMQVEGRAEVRKIALGVSASAGLFSRAVERGADMVIVHHGLFWGNPAALRGVLGRRVAILIKNDVSLLAYHLPLDKHPEIGHNALLMKMLGVRKPEPFGDYHGTAIGYSGKLPRPVELNTVCAFLGKNLGGADVRPVVLPYGPDRVRTVGVISGGAGSMVSEAEGKGIDLFITGEPSESAQEFCRESGISFIAAGHYNSEKPGILALADLLKKKFRVDTEFIDIPNPL